MKKETRKAASKSPAKKKVALKKTAKTLKKPLTPKKSVSKTTKKTVKSPGRVIKPLIKKAAPKKTPIKPEITEIKPVPPQPDASRQLQNQLSHRRPLLIIPK